MKTKKILIMNAVAVMAAAIIIPSFFYYNQSQDMVVEINHTGDEPNIDGPKDITNHKLFKQKKYNYTTTYDKTIIQSNKPQNLDKIKKFLSKTKNQPKLITYNQTPKCKASASTLTDEMYITNCNWNTTIRGVNINSQNWLPFAFFHEIAHFKLINHTLPQQLEQCIADEYAYNKTTKLGYKVERNKTCKLTNVTIQH